MREKLIHLWDNLEEYLCCGLLATVMTLLMVQVLFRYVGGKSLSWSEELSRFVFLYLVYLAASLATSKNVHIRVTAHIKYLPRWFQVGLLLLVDAICLTFCAIVVYVGVEFIIGMQKRPMMSGAMMLDMRYVFVGVPIAFTLQSIRLLERWWRIATGRSKVVVPSEEVF